MIFERFFKPKPNPAQTLYGQIVAAARQPVFYRDMAVPDTVDGRFDMIALHMFMVLERLRSENQTDLRQALVDTFFDDMDRSLREMGVGDISVGKKVRKMAESFYGRVSAYRSALAIDQPALEAAILRNVYVDETMGPHAKKLAAQMIVCRAALETQNEKDIAAGKVAFL